MIYSHVLNCGRLAVRSPAGLVWHPEHVFRGPATSGTVKNLLRQTLYWHRFTRFAQPLLGVVCRNPSIRESGSRKLPVKSWADLTDL